MDFETDLIFNSNKYEANIKRECSEIKYLKNVYLEFSNIKLNDLTQKELSDIMDIQIMFLLSSGYKYFDTSLVLCVLNGLINSIPIVETDISTKINIFCLNLLNSKSFIDDLNISSSSTKSIGLEQLDKYGLLLYNNNLRLIIKSKSRFIHNLNIKIIYEGFRNIDKSYYEYFNDMNLKYLSFSSIRIPDYIFNFNNSTTDEDLELNEFFGGKIQVFSKTPQKGYIFYFVKNSQHADSVFDRHYAYSIYNSPKIESIEISYSENDQDKTIIYDHTNIHIISCLNIDFYMINLTSEYSDLESFANSKKTPSDEINSTLSTDGLVINWIKLHTTNNNNYWMYELRMDTLKYPMIKTLSTNNYKVA